MVEWEVMVTGQHPVPVNLPVVPEQEVSPHERHLWPILPCGHLVWFRGMPQWRRKR